MAKAVNPKQELFTGKTVRVARNLLGSYLVHDSPDGTTVGRIVETEAYLSSDDPACHASRGKTPRNATMFEAAGISYIYFIYGMYYCFNVVTGDENCGEAVLIRALEPVEGIELMMERRKTTKLRELTSGPAKLVLASGITRAHNGWDLKKPPLTIVGEKEFRAVSSPKRRESIVRTTRVGISSGKELQLRFYLKGNEFVSKQ